VPIMFKIERDDEFYVFLKANLPRKYRIEAEPSASYYSEWKFHYNLFEGNNLLQSFEGDFKELEEGVLIHEALKVLTRLKKGVK